MTEPRKSTFAQISDLHLPFPNWAPLKHWNTKRALGLLNWLRSRRRVHRFEAADAIVADLKEHHPDHIAVTGDLVNIGLPQEFQSARAWLETLGPPDRVSVIPGNHDIYSALEEHEQCVRFWSPYMVSDTFGQSLGLGDDAAFPFVRKIGPIVLVGANSAKPTPPFIAQGLVDAEQIEAIGVVLRKIAETGLASCLMLHHPPLPGLAPARRALEDADAVAQMIAGSPVDFVIYGHNHRNALSWLKRSASTGGRDSKIAICGAASASAYLKHHDEPTAQYDLYEVTQQDDTFHIVRVTRGLNDTKDRVVELNRVQLVPSSS